MGVRSTSSRLVLRQLAPVDAFDQGEFVFPEGIPAFEDHTRFALRSDERCWPVCQLQSLVDDAIGFLVVDPRLVTRDYAPDFNSQDLEGLELEPGQVPELLCILVVHQSVGQVTANLKAPVALNRSRHLGKQVILTDERYSLRYPVDLRDARPNPTREAPCSS
jgi:flagellar assembly factor FliW